jgi:phage shock protein PspC (stress-responsive transcriptional regulator)
MTILPASNKDQIMIKTTPLPLRNDTILGVCEAIGRDFGFNPIWLRLAFIAPLFVAPTASFAAYLALGAVVGLVNWCSPDKTATQEAIDTTATAVEEELAIAA